MSKRQTFTARLNDDVTGTFTTARKITHAVALLCPNGQWEIRNWYASRKAAETDGRASVRINRMRGFTDYRVVPATLVSASEASK